MRYLMIFAVICLMSCGRSIDKAGDQISFLKSDQVKLSNPVVSVDALIFKDATRLGFEFGLLDARVFYKIDDGAYQPYSQPLSISESSKISYFTQKAAFQNSDTSHIQLVKSSNKIEGASLTLSPAPHENYPGNGVHSLKDLEKGQLNFRANNAWCGFQSKVVEIDLSFDTAQKINKVILSILEDHNSWIFAPKQIQVFIDKHLIAEKQLRIPTEASTPTLVFLEIPFKATSGKNLKVLIENLDLIPAWHPGRETVPWLFIDEVLVE